MNTTEFNRGTSTVTVTGTSEKIARMEIHGPSIQWILTQEETMPKDLVEEGKRYLAEEASL